MASAAQAKVKLFKEIEELKRKVAEADEAVSALAEAKAELARRDGEAAQLEQWKKDFMEGSKHMNKMKREAEEAKDLAMALKRKLKASDEQGAFQEMRIAKLTDQVKLAEAIQSMAGRAPAAIIKITQIPSFESTNQTFLQRSLDKKP